jgi:hypothetical protein
MIAFQWEVDSATADLFEPVLQELGVRVQRRSLDGRRPDEQIYQRLEEAGLMLDQQQQTHLAGNVGALLEGAAEADVFASAIFRFAHELTAGGLVVDLISEPAQLTEVRHVSGQIIVLADADGARQVQVDSNAIASALRRSLASRTT